MQIRQADALPVAVLVTLLAVLQTPVSGCGDDEAATTKGVSMSAAGARAIKPLPAMTAGAACNSDKECGNGTCSTQVAGSAAALFGDGMLDAPGGYCTKDCSNNAECGEGGTCLTSQQGANIVTGALGGGAAMSGMSGMSMGSTSGGTCYGVCKGPDTCRDGYRCVNSYGQPINSTDNGTCQPTPPTDKLADAVVGKMCSSAEECGGGMCLTTNMLTMSSFPDGYCSGRCLADSDCGSPGYCNLVIPGNTGMCYRKCEVDRDCGREGYRCRADALSGAVAGLLPAQSGPPPAPVTQCEPGAAPLPDGVVGRACTGDDQCGSAAMSCKAQLASPFGGTGTVLPGGYCTQSCIDDTDCGSGGVCSGAFAGIVQGNCFKTCTETSDCRKGYHCGQPATPGLPGGLMIPGFGGAAGAGATMSSQTVCAPDAADTNASDNDAGTP